GRQRGDPTDDQADPKKAEPRGSSSARRVDHRGQTAIEKASPPAVDGTGAGEQHSGYGAPRHRKRQQQKQMRPQALLVRGRGAEHVQQGLAFAGPKVDTPIHGLNSRTGWCGNPNPDSSHLRFASPPSLSITSGAI